MAVLDSIVQDKQLYRPEQISNRTYVPKTSPRSYKPERISSSVDMLMKDVGMIFKDREKLSIAAVQRQAQDKLVDFNVKKQELIQKQNPLESRSKTMGDISLIYAANKDKFENPDLQEAYDSIYTRPAQMSLESSLTTLTREEVKYKDVKLTRAETENIDNTDYSSMTKEDFKKNRELSESRFANTSAGHGREKEYTEELISNSIYNRTISDIKNDPKGFVSGISDVNGNVDKKKLVAKWNAYNGNYGTKKVDKDGNIVTSWSTNSASTQKKLASSWDTMFTLAKSSAGAKKTESDSDVLALVEFSSQPNRNYVGNPEDMMKLIKDTFPNKTIDDGLTLKVLNKMQVHADKGDGEVSKYISQFDLLNVIDVPEHVKKLDSYKRQVNVINSNLLYNYSKQIALPKDDPKYASSLKSLNYNKEAILKQSAVGNMDSIWSGIAKDVVKTSNLDSLTMYGDIINEPEVFSSLTKNLSDADKQMFIMKIAIYNATGVTESNQNIKDTGFIDETPSPDTIDEINDVVYSLSEEDQDNAYTILSTSQKYKNDKVYKNVKESILKEYTIGTSTITGKTFSVKKDSNWNENKDISALDTDELEMFIYSEIKKTARTSELKKLSSGNIVVYKDSSSKNPNIYIVTSRSKNDKFYTSPKFRIDISNAEKKVKLGVQKGPSYPKQWNYNAVEGNIVQ